MDFSMALEELKAGNTVARDGWNSKGQFLRIQYPDTESLMTLPYIYIVTVQGNLVPWLASQIDILAEDWMVM